MSSGKKVAISLIITIFLFATFAVFAHLKLFNLVETRFYQPSLVQGIQEQLQDISSDFVSYTDEQQQAFLDYTQLDSVKSVLKSVQSNSDIQERTKEFTLLNSRFSGLKGFRVVDNYSHIQYSTFDKDILKQSANQISYDNYHDDVADLTTLFNNYQQSKILFDSENQLIIYAFPLNVSEVQDKNVAIFYVSVSDFNNYLYKNKKISMNDTAILVASSDGTSFSFVFGIPKTNQEFFISNIAENWIKNSKKLEELAKIDDETWLILSDDSSNILSISRLQKAEDFEFSVSIKILILIFTFISLLLVLFLLFSLRQDKIVVIRNRIKKFQIALITDCLENKEKQNWQLISKELQKRKNDVAKELKRGLGKKASKYSEEIDRILEEAWKDVLKVAGEPIPASDNLSNQSIEEIKRLLQSIVLQGGTQIVPQNVAIATETTQASPAKALQSKKSAAVDELDEVDEIEEAEEVGSVDELDEVEEVDDIFEEAEEVGSVDELDEVEELDEIEEVGSVDALDESEELEELDEIEEVGSVDELDEVDEVEEVDEVGSVDELYAMETINADFFDTKPVMKPDDVSDDKLFIEELNFSSVSYKEPAMTLEAYRETLDFEITEPRFDDAGAEVATDGATVDNLPQSTQPQVDAADDAANESNEPSFAELEPLEDKPQFFSFTTLPFAANAEPLELEALNDETIFEDNGIFRINDNIDTSEVVQDKSFKELVDSVIIPKN